MKSIVILVLVLMLSSVSFCYWLNTRRESEKLVKLVEKVNFSKNLMKASHDLKRLEFINQAKNLNLLTKISAFTGKETFIADLVKNKKKLVFCILENVCNSCHENTLKKLKNIEKIVGLDKIVIFVDKHMLRVTNVEMQDRGCKIPVHGIDFSQLGIDIHYVPFIMIVDGKGIAENLFVPNSFDPALTEAYILDIKKRYFL